MAKSTFKMHHHSGTEDTFPEVKSYKTLENLEAALAKMGIADHRHMVCLTLDGRYTAVFPASSLRERDIHYMGFYSQLGFMTLG